MRGQENETLVTARACTLTIPTSQGGEIKVGAVATGRRLLILCDEYPLQNWIREHDETLLQAVVEAFGVKLKELRIYADTHK